MKTLLLLRHAKSSWDDPSQRDFDRPLNERGRQAAPSMGRFLLRRQIRPALVLCSPAERAKQTAELFLAAAESPAECRFDERIYDATYQQLLQVITGVEDQHDPVLLVGHNPGMEELIGRLAGESRRMPTAALACLDLSIERWVEARELCGSLNWLQKPKELTDQ